MGPGVHLETIALEGHVSIEGSGEGVTTLRGPGGTISGFAGDASATLRVSGVIHAEVRELTVESITTSDWLGWGRELWHAKL